MSLLRTAYKFPTEMLKALKNLIYSETVQSIADAQAAAVEIAKPYKVYFARLDQTGTENPVATVFENTLDGDIVWTRSTKGDYLGTLAGAFNFDTVAFFITTQPDSMYNPTIMSFGIGVNNENSVYLSTGKTTTAGSRTPEDDVLTNGVFLEIRVYPTP